jgi:branched-chain amino acid transport system substrate-binding protein
MKVRDAVGVCQFDGPQGPVWIDSENHHSYLTPRLGRSMRNGQFEILHAADGPIKPDPYLTWFDPVRDVHRWSMEQRPLATRSPLQLRVIR